MSMSSMKVGNKIFTIGDKVKSSLDCFVKKDKWYTGIIRHINTHPDCVEICIDRDDDESGSGPDGTWKTKVRKDNIDYIKKISAEWDEKENF